MDHAERPTPPGSRRQPPPPARGQASAPTPTGFAGPLAAGLWSAAYLALWLTGQEFSLEFLGRAWQLVPLEVLRADPLGSVWNLHIQPPLWNLVVGTLPAVSPLPEAATFQLAWFLVGALAAGLLGSLLVRVTGRPLVGAGLAFLAMLDPQVLAHAFAPTYELPTACGLLLLLVLLERRPRSASFALAAIALTATAVTLTRALFHPLWLGGILGLASWGWRRDLDRSALTRAWAIPLVLVGGWLAKNTVLFGRPTLSSWFGMNLQRAVLPVASASERAAWLAAGGISRPSADHPMGFGTYALYESEFGPCPPQGVHPALAPRIRDDLWRTPNFNALCYLPVFDRAGSDAWWVIRHHPGHYLAGRALATALWFVEAPAPQTRTSPLHARLSSIGDSLLLPVTIHRPSIRIGTREFGNGLPDLRLSLLRVGASLAVLLAGLLAARRAGGADPERGPTDLVALAAAWTLGSSMATGILFELGEQARFRSVTDPLVMGLAVAYLFRVRSRPVARPDARVPTGP